MLSSQMRQLYKLKHIAVFVVIREDRSLVISLGLNIPLRCMFGLELAAGVGQTYAFLKVK